jgi:hypothetical protein
MSSSSSKLVLSDIPKLLQQGKLKKKHLSGPGSLNKKDLMKLAIENGWDRPSTNGIIKRVEIENFLIQHFLGNSHRRTSSDQVISNEVVSNNSNNTSNNTPRHAWTKAEVLNRLSHYHNFEQVEKDFKSKKLSHHGLRIVANHLFQSHTFGNDPRKGKTTDLLLFIKNGILHSLPFASIPVASIPVASIPAASIQSSTTNEALDETSLPIVNADTSTPEAERDTSSTENKRKKKRLVPTDTSAEEISTWPVDLSTIQNFTVKDLKILLEKYGIKSSLGNNKETLLNLFKKKRCDKSAITNLICSEEEVCDLRNRLCRDDITKYTKNFTIFKYKGHKILGEKKMEQEIKRLMDSSTTSSFVNPSPSPSLSLSPSLPVRPPPPSPLSTSSTTTTTTTVPILLPVVPTTMDRPSFSVKNKLYEFHPPRYSKYFNSSKEEEEDMRNAVMRCFQVMSTSSSPTPSA